MHVGSQLEVHARINLGNLKTEDVEVQLSHGLVDNAGDIPHPAALPMHHNGTLHGSAMTFKGTIPCRASGHYGYAVAACCRTTPTWQTRSSLG